MVYHLTIARAEDKYFRVSSLLPLFFLPLPYQTTYPTSLHALPFSSLLLRSSHSPISLHYCQPSDLAPLRFRLFITRQRARFCQARSSLFSLLRPFSSIPRSSNHRPSLHPAPWPPPPPPRSSGLAPTSTAPVSRPPSPAPHMAERSSPISLAATRPPRRPFQTMSGTGSAGRATR